MLESKDEWTAGFAIGNVVYRFSGNQLTVFGESPEPQTLAIKHSINAAFVGTDNRIYIFRKPDYISFPNGSKITGPTIISSINAWESQPNETQWGKIGDNIARTGKIDAAFCDGEKTYLFSGDEYVVYSGDTYAASRRSYPDAGYPKKISANTERIPKWDRIDAVLQTFTVDKTKGEIYFFRNSDQIFTPSSNLRSRTQTVTRWGRVLVLQGNE